MCLVHGACYCDGVVQRSGADELRPLMKGGLFMRRILLLLGTMGVGLLLASGVALAVTISGGAGSAEADTATVARSPDDALDRALKELVAMEGGPPGVIAVVQRGQHREVHSFGVANLKNERPMRIDDRMRIASAAKAFSGAVALSLVSKGKLSLNDTIGERLPELPEAWSKVTLRQLLNHTSGIPDFSLDPDFQEALLASLKKAPPPEELLSFVEDDEDLLFDPGSEYHYSNSDNIIVALMAEAATGKPYEELLRELVYKPLGLKNTTLPRGTNLKKPFIHGYDTSKQPP